MAGGTRIIGMVAVLVASLAWAGPPDGWLMESAAALPEDTSEVLVFLQPGTDVKQFAQDHGMVLRRALRSGANAYVLAASSVAAAREAEAIGAATDGRVRAAYVNRRTHYVRMAFVPDDPYFPKDRPSEGWPGQWHLVNGHAPGLDARVQGAWLREITGSGVTIGMVDDCLPTDHPDLAPNFVAADSWDFGDDDNDPGPSRPDDMHGAATAGVAAARGGNGIGVTGAAPRAGLAGLRIDFASQNTQQFVDATLYHSSGASTGIAVKNHSYGAIVPYVATPAEKEALAISTASGTIHCFAAGNQSADASKIDLQNSPDAITVAALGSDGRRAGYSNYGACVTVTAPSSSYGLLKVTTTDRPGEAFGYNGADDAFPDADYTSAFGGTSSASPLVAGVMALARQVQPALNTRFAKHLLARSSSIVDSADPEWQTNAAGFHFNPRYGFGLINADELTRLATCCAGVTPLTTEETALVTVEAPIPDNSATGLSRTFSLGSSTPLEELLIHVKVTHPAREDVEAWVTSPSGTRGRLFAQESSDRGPGIDWTFTTNQFWGEVPAGTWTLTVKDLRAGGTGVWNQFRVIARLGTLQPASGEPVIVRHPAGGELSVGDTALFVVEAVGAQPLSYRWRKDGVDLVDGGRVLGAATDTLRILDCRPGDGGAYACVASNPMGAVSSNAAALTVAVQCIVESRPGGRNHDRYSEIGVLSDSVAKSTAAGTTLGVGSRWGYMDPAAYGIVAAVYRFTPQVAGTYDVFVTWPASTNASEAVEHIVTHAAGSSSVVLDQDNVSNPTGAGRWNRIGSYPLAAGTDYTVTQTNENYPDVGEIFRADAVKWRLVAECAEPPLAASASPEHGWNDEIVVVSVCGSGLVPGQTSVRLVAEGVPDIPAGGVAVQPDGLSLTCEFDLRGAPAAVRDVVVGTTNCPPSILSAAFTVLQTQRVAADFDRDGDVDLADFAHIHSCFNGPGRPSPCEASGSAGSPSPDAVSATGDIPAGVPLAFVEKWDAYATGTEASGYLANWLSVPGASRYWITNSKPFSFSNSLLINNNPGGPFAITRDLTPSLRAAVPEATEVRATDEEPLDAVFYIWMGSTNSNLKYGDAFIELSMGDVHAPAAGDAAVVPVLAFGMTHGINGETKSPCFFDGRSWTPVGGVTSTTGWNFFRMTVRSDTCFLTEYRNGTYVETRPRLYTGGFDRISIRTADNRGEWRSLDDVYLTGGSIVASCATPAEVASVTPNRGRADHVIDPVVIEGAGFVPGETSVRLVGTGRPDILATEVSVAADGESLTCRLDLAGAEAGLWTVAVSTPTCPAATLTGGFEVLPAAYADADLDHDGDVDLEDFAIFQDCFNGPNRPPACR